MTVKKFSDKYGISYATVYREIYNVTRTGPKMWRGQEYDEEEMKEAIRKSSLRRIAEHEQKILLEKEILKKIGDG